MLQDEFINGRGTDDSNVSPNIVEVPMVEGHVLPPNEYLDLSAYRKNVTHRNMYRQI